MGGRCADTNEVIVECSCSDCMERVARMPRFVPCADKWARLMTLEVRPLLLYHGRKPHAARITSLKQLTVRPGRGIGRHPTISRPRSPY